VTSNTAIEILKIKEKYDALKDELNERQRRIWAVAEAKAMGRGGISWVTKATGIARSTIYRGSKDLEKRGQDVLFGTPRIRRRGGGRKQLQSKNPNLLNALDSLIEPSTRGDPETPLRWTSTSTYVLADQLRRRGHQITAETVRLLLHSQGYSLQANRKTREGKQHPERDLQFRYISRRVKAQHRASQPVISVDTKKKELVGDFRNQGKIWRPKGKPYNVRVHDWVDDELGKVIPYGVYDLVHNKGWVNVGIDHDTAEFAVESIRRWWQRMGSQAYPNASELLITADSGGSNGHRQRLWKYSLQQFATETGLIIHVTHFPPGTSKWNKIEHRMFSFITKTWQGKPMLSRQAVVDLIGSTKTKTGLEIKAAIDPQKYPTGIKISEEEFRSLRIVASRTRGAWNYTVYPKL